MTYNSPASKNDTFEDFEEESVKAKRLRIPADRNLILDSFNLAVLPPSQVPYTVIQKRSNTFTATKLTVFSLKSVIFKGPKFI